MLLSSKAIMILMVMLFAWAKTALVAGEPLQGALSIRHTEHSVAELGSGFGRRSAERPALQRRGRREQERKKAREKIAEEGEQRAAGIPPLGVPSTGRQTEVQAAARSLEALVEAGGGAPDAATRQQLEHFLHSAPSAHERHHPSQPRRGALDLGGSRLRPRTDASYDYLKLVARGAPLREDVTYGVRVAQVTPKHLVKLIMGPVRMVEERVEGRPAYVLTWTAFVVWLTDRGPSSLQWVKHWDTWKPPRKPQPRLPVFLGEGRHWEQIIMNCT